MKKKFGKKTLIDEKTKFSVDTKNLIIYLIGLYILIFILVSIVLYNPSVSSTSTSTTTNDETTSNEYSTTSDDIVVDKFGDNCEKSVLNEMIEEASKIKFDFNLTEYDTGVLTVPTDEGEEPEEMYAYGYNMNFSNIGSDIALYVTNDVNDDVYEINLNGDQPKVTFLFKDIDEKAKFDVKVYANVSTCSYELIREFILSLPRYNSNSELGYCQNSDDENCDQLTYDESSEYVLPGTIDEDTKEIVPFDSDSSDTSNDSWFKLPGFSIVNALIITSIIYCILVIVIYTLFKVLNKKKVGVE